MKSIEEKSGDNIYWGETTFGKFTIKFMIDILCQYVEDANTKI